MNCKKILAISLASFFIASILSTAYVSAQSDKSDGKGLCLRLQDYATKVINNFADRQARLDKKRLERLDKISSLQNNFDQKLANQRLRWDENRVAQFAKLEEKASTDPQKQAAIQFKNAMTEAIAIRRTAVDLAILTFRQNLKQAIDTRKTAVDTAVISFKNSAAAAFQKAQNDCTAGVDAKTIRTELMQDLKDARDQYNSNRQSIINLGNLVESLANTRKQAVEKAHDDFKIAAEKARTDLKNAWGETSPSPSPTLSPSPSPSPSPTPSATP